MAASRRTRARDANRDSTVEALEAAYADGQLTGDEFHSRTAAALRAETLGELSELVVDLQLATPPARATNEPRRTVASGAIAVGLLAAATVGIVAAIASDGGDEVPVTATTAYDPTTAEGFETFVGQVEERTDTTVVHHVQLGRDFSIIAVPIEGGEGGRYVEYDWRDGEMTPSERTGSGMYDRTIDLADIDPSAIEAAIDEAETLVEEAEAGSATIGFDIFARATPPPKAYCFSARASNRFGEGAELVVSCEGDVLSRVEP